MAASSISYKNYEIRRRDPNPKSSALLVIDMQNHFSSIAKPILSALRLTINLCRSAGVPIIYTRHSHRSPAESSMLAEWWPGDLIFDGTPAADLLPEIGRRDGDRVVQKNTYSAFEGTVLEQILRDSEVEEVIVTGVMTNLCCETTAREAFVKGFRVFFSTDATGTSNRDLHEATLKNLSYGFAYLVDCLRLKAALSDKDC